MVSVGLNSKALLCAGILASALCGCSVLDTDVQRGFAQDRTWTTPSVFTTGDVRIAMQRQQPRLGNTVICLEPSPDVAKALSTATAASAQGGNGAASGGISAQGSSAEAVAELAGRSTALLGIRDGLFRACEAYANGAIGQGAYALVLSRYAQLMTTLFLGQDITGAAGAEGKAIANSAVLQTLGQADQTSGSKPAATTTTTTTSPGKAANPAAYDKKSAPPPAATLVSDAEISARPRVIEAVDAPAAPTPAKPAPAPPAAAQKNPSPSTGTATPGSKPSDAAAGLSTGTALALVRMNEDYLHQDILGPLIVACIDEYDPTRLPVVNTLTNPPTERTNPWLDAICEKLKDLDLATLSNQLTQTWKLVTPEAAAGWTSATGANASRSAKSTAKQ